MRPHPWRKPLRIISGINDLESLEPELAKEWSKKNPIPASAVGVGSHKKAIWKGRCGHEWSAVIRNRVAGAGCPYCSHNIVLPGFNDLEILFPEVAQEWSPRNLPLKPSQVTAYSNKKVWWQCEHGHEWYTLISTRSYGSKCPYCSGIKLLKGFNDFATLHPGLALEWSEQNGSLMPDSVNEKSTKNVWWHCSECGNEYKAVVKSRVKGLRCPVCAQRAVLPGCNDLATTDRELRQFLREGQCYWHLELRGYSESYLNDVVENQGKLFDYVAHQFPFMNNQREALIKMAEDYIYLNPPDYQKWLSGVVSAIANLGEDG